MAGSANKSALSESRVANLGAQPVTLQQLHHEEETKPLQDQQGAQVPMELRPEMQAAQAPLSLNPETQGDLVVHPPEAQGIQIPVLQENRMQPQVLTLKDKKAICLHRELNPSATLSRLIQFVEETTGKRTTHSTVRRVLQKKHLYLSLENAPDDHQRIRQAKHPELEQALNAWYDETIQNDERVTSDSLKQKATELAEQLNIPRKDFAASNGWLARFKHRKGIAQGRASIGKTSSGSGLQSDRMALGMPAMMSGQQGQVVPPAQGYQAQLLAGTMPSAAELATGEYRGPIAIISPSQIVPPVSAEDAHRCAELLASFMHAHPQSFSTEFQLDFTRNCTARIGQIIIEDRSLMAQQETVSQAQIGQPQMAQNSAVDPNAGIEQHAAMAVPENEPITQNDTVHPEVHTIDE